MNNDLDCGEYISENSCNVAVNDTATGVEEVAVSKTAFEEVGLEEVAVSKTVSVCLGENVTQSSTENLTEKSAETVKEKGGFLSLLKKRVTAKRLALTAVFVALSYAVSFIEIPAPFFGASFLKLDFGNVFILLISFLLGPIEGVTVCLLKESLRLIGGTGAGEIANFLVTSTFILLPSIAYQKNKTFKTVIITLIISTFIATSVSLVVNRVIVFPAFALVGGGTIFGMTVEEAFSKFWLGVLAFNFIKTVSVSLLTLLLYKRLSNVLKKWNF